MRVFGGGGKAVKFREGPDEQSHYMHTYMHKHGPMLTTACTNFKKKGGGGEKVPAKLAHEFGTLVRTTGCVEVSASGSPLKTNCCASKHEKVLIGMQDLSIYTLLLWQVVVPH